MQFATVHTCWGTVLFAGGRRGLKHLVMPGRVRQNPHAAALELWPDAEYNAKLFPALQVQIKNYFLGEAVSFRVELDLSEFSEFQRCVLLACRHELPHGATVTYGELARLSGHPGAARAVGSVMAKNRLPLIVPCHRVVRSDHSLGGFSAPGGIDTKRRLLDLETRTTRLAS